MLYSHITLPLTHRSPSNETTPASQTFPSSFPPYLTLPATSIDHPLGIDHQEPSARQAFAATVAAVAAPVVAPSSTAVKNVMSSQDKVHVPISLCLMILATYISGGGFLFSIWEEDWGYLEGSYFCFISLSTIGFGDLVPGSAVASGEGTTHHRRLIICSLYLLVGLALIAMCFNLMQEEVIHKVRNIGRNLGIIRDREFEEESDEDDEDQNEGIEAAGPSNQLYGFNSPPPPHPAMMLMGNSPASSPFALQRGYPFSSGVS